MPPPSPADSARPPGQTRRRRSAPLLPRLARPDDRAPNLHSNRSAPRPAPGTVGRQQMPSTLRKALRPTPISGSQWKLLPEPPASARRPGSNRRVTIRDPQSTDSENPQPGRASPVAPRRGRKRAADYFRISDTGQDDEQRTQLTQHDGTPSEIEQESSRQNGARIETANDTDTSVLGKYLPSRVAFFLPEPLEGPDDHSEPPEPSIM